MKFDENTNKFVEPFLPNFTIGIMHLAAGIWVENDDMRTNKNIKIKLKTVQGGEVNKSLRYENK